MGRLLFYHVPSRHSVYGYVYMCASILVRIHKGGLFEIHGLNLISPWTIIGPQFINSN